MTVQEVSGRCLLLVGLSGNAPPQKNYAKIYHSQYVLFAGLSVECVLCNSSRCWYCFQWVQDGLMYSCGTITHLCLRPGKTLDWALKRGDILRAYRFYGKIRHFLVSPLVAVELVSLRSWQKGPTEEHAKVYWEVFWQKTKGFWQKTTIFWQKTKVYLSVGPVSEIFFWKDKIFSKMRWASWSSVKCRVGGGGVSTMGGLMLNFGKGGKRCGMWGNQVQVTFPFFLWFLCSVHLFLPHEANNPTTNFRIWQTNWSGPPISREGVPLNSSQMKDQAATAAAQCDPPFFFAGQGNDR